MELIYQEARQKAPNEFFPVSAECVNNQHFAALYANVLFKVKGDVSVLCFHCLQVAKNVVNSL